MSSPKISAIAAVAENRAIGKNGQLLWHISEDFQYFKNTTTGHVVIMGLNTFKELNFKPLPNRTNIILTLDKKFKAPGCIVCFSLDEAIQKAKEIEKEEIFIIGGGSVYAKALPLVERLYITLVHAAFPDADTFFPDYSEFKKIISRRDSQDENYQYTFFVLERE